MPDQPRSHNGGNAVEFQEGRRQALHDRAQALLDSGDSGVQAPNIVDQLGHLVEEDGGPRSSILECHQVTQELAQTLHRREAAGRVGQIQLKGRGPKAVQRLGRCRTRRSRRA